VLAAAYAEAGDFEKAVRWQEKANDRYIDPEDRQRGKERLELYKEEKPYRDAKAPTPAQQRSSTRGSAGSKAWSEFPDPELAGRAFAELEDRIGKLPDGANPHDRRVRAKRLVSIEEDISKKYHLKLAEVKAIWRAGSAMSPADHP
jgi:hypothetical protein